MALRRNHGSGAPTLVELTPDRHGCAAAVERALLADTPGDVWRGTLDRLGSFWEQRAGLALDARPLGAGRGWLVRVRSERRATGQSLVAPFPIARAVGADGHPLAVKAGNRVVLPAFRGADRRRRSSPRARRSTGRGILRLAHSAKLRLGSRGSSHASQAPHSSVDRKPRERDAPSQTKPMTAVSRTA